MVEETGASVDSVKLPVLMVVTGEAGVDVDVVSADFCMLEVNVGATMVVELTFSTTVLIGLVPIFSSVVVLSNGVEVVTAPEEDVVKITDDVSTGYTLSVVMTTAGRLVDVLDSEM